MIMFGVFVVVMVCVWAILAWRHYARYGRGLAEVKAIRSRSQLHQGLPLGSVLTRSATELARMIREREMSSVQIVQSFIDRIERVNGALNAMVYKRFDEALKEAAEADRRVVANEANIPPFCGVPATIKEAFAVKGCPQTGGLLSRKGYIATVDADCVAAMRSAGFIVLGVTNVR